MSDAMSFAEVGEQYVELLPARTVLSLLHTGANGEPGTRGSDGASVSKFSLWGIVGYGGSDPSYPHGAGDTGQQR